MTVGRPDVAVSSGIAAPAWCCGSSGSVPGLTTYGQANMDGQGQTARDAAIAAAVKDATAQATVAADAAGITLGPIIDMQVSAMPSYYPMPMAGTTSGTATGTSGIVTRIVGHRWHGARSGPVLRLRERDDDLVPRLSEPLVRDRVLLSDAA